VESKARKAPPRCLLVLLVWFPKGREEVGGWECVVVHGVRFGYSRLRCERSWLRMGCMCAGMDGSG